MQRKNITYRELFVSGLLFAILIAGIWQKWWPFWLVEAFGFITGGLCVWMVVKENIWNWPLGIANNIFFIVLFFETGLYADTVLQFIYIGLSIVGWYWWLHGGERRTELQVRTADTQTMVLSAVIGIAATAVVTVLLIEVKGSAPFWDAVTTTLSLAAQYLMTRKLVENWYFWIAADLIYIPLYVSKGLYLTALLYTLFLWMCVQGLRQWRATLSAPTGAETAA